MATMRTFFAGVGQGHAAGIWQDVPRDRPEFRRDRAKAKPKDDGGAIGC
jgi:chlorophyllide a reductase subunit Y